MQLATTLPSRLMADGQQGTTTGLTYVDTIQRNLVLLRGGAELATSTSVIDDYSDRIPLETTTKSSALSAEPKLPGYGWETTERPFCLDEQHANDDFHSLSRDGKLASESEDVSQNLAGAFNQQQYPTSTKMDGKTSKTEDAYLAAHPPCLENLDEGDNNSKLRPNNPVVYRYFGRSRARSHRSDSIPFILLGPSVDHWKDAGQILASRGFNVMACERVSDKNGSGEKSIQHDTALPHDGAGENLVLAILDALRWNRAVVIGCDNESALAIEAALRLAPERVAGLVLCGDLSSAESYLSQRMSMDGVRASGHDQPSIDSFLDECIDVPTTIVWDGDITTMSKGSKHKFDQQQQEDLFNKYRSIIVGGGSAPHRRLPEQFAWVLTRFVEEKVSTHTKELRFLYEDHDPKEAEEKEVEADTSKQNALSFALPDGLNRTLADVFSPGSLLVAGRTLATALIYMSAIRVAVYQYHNICGGLSGIQSGWNTLSAWQREGREYLSMHLSDDWGRIASFFRDFFVHLFFRHRNKSEKDDTTEDITTEEATSEEATPEHHEETEIEKPAPRSDEYGQFFLDIFVPNQVIT